MPHILIVESTPAALSALGREATGTTAGEAYAATLRAIDPQVQTTIISPYDGDAMPDLDAFDGVVFGGSAVDWSTDDARVAPLADVMRAAFAARLPVLGSCNGMQLAASVLGGSSGPSPNGMEIGLAEGITVTDAGRAHPMMRGRDPVFAVPAIHAHEVWTLPEGAVLLAGNAHSPVQAFAYDHDGISAWGMQYHPEFPPTYLADLMAGRDLAPAEDTAAVAARAGDPDQQTDRRAVEVANWLAQL